MNTQLQSQTHSNSQYQVVSVTNQMRTKFEASSVQPAARFLRNYHLRSNEVALLISPDGTILQSKRKSHIHLNG